MGIRANINLDPDAYSFASAYANAKGIPLGTAVSELLRRAEQGPSPTADSPVRLKVTPRGYFVKPKTGRAVTSEMVKKASEDEFA